MIEQEVKLEFGSVEAARQAVTHAGGRLDVSRRFLDDRLFDTVDERLRQSRSALRIRRDHPRAILTFKGPGQAGPVKSREEIETEIGCAAIGETLLASLGFRRWFRAEKYREEYVLGAARVTVDETPVGVFVEIEGQPAEIERITTELGRHPDEYRLESYPQLYVAWCQARGITPGDMLFAPEA